MTTGGVMLYLCTRPKADFQNKDEAFAINHKSYELKISIMFTNAALNTSNWLQQKDHGSVATRPVPVRFSFGSRSLLVRSSFVSRSSLVAYSLVYRGPIEDRTRNKQKTNERATNIDRDADGKLSATRRFATVMAGRIPFCNHKPAYCLLPRQIAALSAPPRHSHGESSLFHPFCTFQPTTKAPHRL